MTIFYGKIKEAYGNLMSDEIPKFRKTDEEINDTKESTMNFPYSTGYIPDRPDFRDYKISSISTRNLQSKTVVDYTKEMSRVKDQGNAGACVGFAIASMLEWQQQQEYLKEIENGSTYTRDKKHYDLSEQWIYHKAREIDGFNKDTEGTTLRAALKIVNKKGVPPEEGWKYDDSAINEPEFWAYSVAKWARNKSYYKIESIDEMKETLQKAGPFVSGVLVYPEWKYPNKNGYVKFPNNIYNYIGGHALCCHPETSITTNNSIKKIIDIEKDDKVLTRNGYKKVTNLSKRYINENIYNIYSNLSINPLKVTGEHPILVKKCSPRTRISLLNMNNFEFVEAKDVKKGYFVKTVIDDNVAENNITSDFAWLLGYYIGDGNLSISYSKNGNIKSIKLRFTYHKENDIDNIEKLIKIIKKYDSTINYSKNIDTKTNTGYITFYSTELGKEILNLCGGPKNKDISTDMLYMEKTKQIEFIKGWWSADGHSEWMNNSGIFTSEENLAEQLIFILQRNRLIYRFDKRKPGNSIIYNKKYNCKGGYNICFHNKSKRSRIYYKDNYIYTRIKDIIEEKYDGYVYNFEVDELHEYIANNIIVHNCIVGYDDNKKWFKFKSSWSKNWGNKGYGWLSYEYMKILSIISWVNIDNDVKNI